MAGKGAEKTFFRAFPMGNHDGSFEPHSHLWPQREQGRGGVKILGANAVDLASGPLNRLIGKEVGPVCIAVALSDTPSGEADLDWAIGLATGSTSGFEVDGGETGLVDEWHGASLCEASTSSGKARFDGIENDAKALIKTNEGALHRVERKFFQLIESQVKQLSGESGFLCH